PPPQVLPNIRFALRPGDHDPFPAGARYRRRECLEQVAAVLTATGRRHDKWAPSPVGAGRPWIVGLRKRPSGGRDVPAVAGAGGERGGPLVGRDEIEHRGISVHEYRVVPLLDHTE